MRLSIFAAAIIFPAPVFSQDSSTADPVAMQQAGFCFYESSVYSSGAHINANGFVHICDSGNWKIHGDLYHSCWYNDKFYSHASVVNQDGEKRTCIGPHWKQGVH